jgi:hypothetical protein
LPKHIRIHDDYPSQTTHICVGKRVFHASVAGDAKSAECLETGDTAKGQTRQECLDLLAAMIVANVSQPVFGVIG